MKESKIVRDDRSAGKATGVVAERPEKSIQAVVERWYTNKLSDEVSRSIEAAGEQVLNAVVKLVDRIALAGSSVAECDSAIDAWFEEHFHQPPVSHDTRLYNTLHAAKEELKAMLSADA
jgi:hypothetical protein